MKPPDTPDPQTYALIRAAMEFHRQLGHGFSEPVYQEPAAIEFPPKNIPFEAEVPLAVKYRNITLPVHYRADFVCFSGIIDEFKAISTSALPACNANALFGDMKRIQ